MTSGCSALGRATDENGAWDPISLGGCRNVTSCLQRWSCTIGRKKAGGRRGGPVIVRPGATEATIGFFEVHVFVHVKLCSQGRKAGLKSENTVIGTIATAEN